MLSFIKKYVMKEIDYESYFKPIKIENINIDYESSFKPIKIENTNIDYESIIKSEDIKINLESMLPAATKSYLTEDRRYDCYNSLPSNFFKDIEKKINKYNSPPSNFFKDKESNKKERLLCTKGLRQQENFQKSIENVILFRVGEFHASYDVPNISTHMESITQSNRDLVLLLLLIYSNIPLGNNIQSLEDLIKNDSGSRVRMIEGMHSLGGRGELSIKSSKCLDYIIKMSTFIEKQCRSNIVSVMNMVSSGNVDGLVQNVEARVKNLIGIDIGYDKHSPASSLKDLSIDTLVKHGLIK